MADRRLRQLQRDAAVGDPEAETRFLREQERIGEAVEEDEEDICGLCGEPGADKMATWTGGGVYWPGEEIPDSEFVHDECEREERARAHSLLSTEEIRAILRGLGG